MSLLLGGVLVVLGMVGAFVSGLLGVGGAIVMIPLLLYVPPLLGIGGFDVKEVAAITMVQVFIAALSGVIAHGRRRAVNARLAATGGLAMAATSLAGAIASLWIHEMWLLMVFALMITLACVLMFVPAPQPDVAAPAEDREYSRTLTATVAGGVGFAAGLVGAGGAFLLVPLLLVVVGVPIRVTIGSSLAITALAATAGFVGKLVTGQVPLLPTLAVVAAAAPGAQLGAVVSRRVPPLGLRVALCVFIATTAVRVWVDLLWR